MINIYAYDAGYSDGAKWSEPEKVVTDGWHEVTIHAISAGAFGLRCGLTELEISERGQGWVAACKEYDRGCVDGAKAGPLRGVHPEPVSPNTP